MAKPAPIIVGDTFLDWRTRYNILLDQVPEVVESPTLAPTAADDTYEVGTIWVKLDSDLAWMLVHTTGAADSVWSALGAGMANLVEDVTPQLGGPLDMNGQDRIWDSVNGSIYIGDGFGYVGDTSFIDLTSYQAALAQAQVHVGADNDTNGSSISFDTNYVFSKTLMGQVYNPTAWTGDAYLLSSGSVRIKAPIVELIASESLILGPNGACDIRIQSDPSGQKPILLWSGGHLDIKSGVLTESTYNANYDINFRASRNINLDAPSGLVRVNGLELLTTDDLTGLDADTVDTLHASQLLDRANHTGLIQTADIDVSAVTAAELASSSVTAIKIANDNVDNTKLSNMGAYTIKVRKEATVGDPQDSKISALSQKSNPGTGDWILGEDSTGVLSKYDVGHIGGGISWVIKTADYSIVPNEGVVIDSGGTSRTITVPSGGSLVIGDEYIVHHNNTGQAGSIVTIADNGNIITYNGVDFTNDITLESGETVHLIATATNILQII